MANDLAFARAARDYYRIITGRDDWRTLRPEERSAWRGRLRSALQVVDKHITGEATTEP